MLLWLSRMLFLVTHVLLNLAAHFLRIALMLGLMPFFMSVRLLTVQRLYHLRRMLIWRCCLYRDRCLLCPS